LMPLLVAPFHLSTVYGVNFIGTPSKPSPVVILSPDPE
jgi:hypothetical protein